MKVLLSGVSLCNWCMFSEYLNGEKFNIWSYIKPDCFCLIYFAKLIRFQLYRNIINHVSEDCFRRLLQNVTESLPTLIKIIFVF